MAVLSLMVYLIYDPLQRLTMSNMLLAHSRLRLRQSTPANPIPTLPDSNVCSAHLVRETPAACIFAEKCFFSCQGHWTGQEVTLSVRPLVCLSQLTIGAFRL